MMRCSMKRKSIGCDIRRLWDCARTRTLEAWSRRMLACPPPLFGGSFLGKALTGLCLFVSLVPMNEDQVRKARKQLLRELPDPTEILRGSLLDRRIFHRRGCRKCR